MTRDLMEDWTTQAQPLQRDADDGDRDATPLRSKRSPLSPEQRQVWLHAALAPGLGVYNEPVAIRRKGRLDAAVLERCLNEIVRRHDTLRTIFPAPGGEPIAVVLPKLHIAVPVVDLSHLPVAERDAEATRLTEAEVSRLFDLDTGPLIRAHALSLAEDEHLVIVTIHHLAFDAVSMNRVLLTELAELYDAFTQGRRPALEPLPLQYADYVAWREQQVAGKSIAARTRQWARRLAGAPGTLPLPYDRPRPAMSSFLGAAEEVEFPPELTDRLKALSAAQGVTLFMTLLAGFSAVLYRYTGQEDILVGGIASTRRQPGLERLIGCFINLVALRTRPAAGVSFRDHLAQTRETVLNGFVAGDVPFDQVVRAVQPKREPSVHPLVQAVLSLETSDAKIGEAWEATYLDGSSGTSKFDIALSLHEHPDRIVGGLVYSTDLFDTATMQRLIGHWINLLEGAAADPDCPLGELPLLSADETRQVLVDWNRTKREFPNLSLYELFAAQAAKAPDATAVVFRDRAWTYRELLEAAGRIATALRGQGVGRDTLVGLCVERSFEMMAGLLGVLQAGAAYLPLDPAFPPARLALMLDDGKPPVVLTQRSLLSALPDTDARIVLCEECTGPAASAAIHVGGDDLAYVLYTSGSTGRPNGVAVPQRAVVNLLTSMQREPGFTSQDALLAVTTLSFDIAALELFLPLISGGRVILADRETAMDPLRLAALIGDSLCTMIQATPATWRGLSETGWQGNPGLTLLCGGEALPRELADKLLRGGARLWNVYGPTETTIWSTVYPVTAGTGPVPIGYPIANTTTYILDPAGRPVPIGVAGDLFIGGTGVTRGYLHRSELTAERFVSDPFVGDPSARMYRTGDVARFLRDGAIEYLGRRDRQVKIRGFRIEPGDIEAALTTHPAIRQAVVIVREDTPGDARLAAYLVETGETKRPSPGALRQQLGAELPNYMLPNAFVWLDTLPMTPNGKIDRNALPAPDMPVGSDDFVPPSGEYEERLAALWRKLLRIERIGATDDFFELGGHSLLMLPLQAQIEAEFGRRLSITAMFQGPTVRQIAVQLDDNAAASAPRTVSIQPHGTRPPLYWIDPGPVFNPLVKALGEDQPFVGLTFNTVVTQGEDRPSRIADIAPYIVDSIRAAQPEGPYYLGGWCANGLLAYDVASRLITDGQQVGLLVLLHAGNPAHIRRLGKFAVGYSTLKHQLRRLGRLRDKNSRDLALERARLGLARILRRFGLPAPPGPVGHYFSGIIDATAINYVPQPYAGDIALFQPLERPDVYDYRAGWLKVIQGELFAYDVPGGHHTMLHEPNVQELAARLRACLDHVQSRRRQAETPRAAA
jgi:amino acid adenylation domain-containing protein